MTSTTPKNAPDRLCRRSDFLRLRDGKKWVSPSVIVQAAPAADGFPMRVGFTATKKLGGAVTRNRIKRRLREAVRAALDGKEAQSHDIVLIGRSETETCDYAKLVKDLSWCFRKLHICS